MENIIPRRVNYEKIYFDKKKMIWEVRHDVRQLRKNPWFNKAYRLKFLQRTIYVGYFSIFYLSKNNFPKKYIFLLALIIVLASWF